MRVGTSLTAFLRHDRRGVAAIEFGVFALVLIVAIVNVADVGMYTYDKMEVADASQIAVQAAWQTCDTTKLPATVNCSGLSSAISAAVGSTVTGFATIVNRGAVATQVTIDSFVGDPATGKKIDTRTINLPYAFDVIEVGPAFLALPRVIAFAAVIVVALGLWLLMRWTDIGKAIRAVAKEKLGAELAGIDVAHIYAVTFGLGSACLAIAACLLLPTYYVNPSAGNAFVLIAFTIVVLGGMGSVAGALIGGLFVGVVESLSGLYLGESLGQIGIFLMFILVLLLRPNGLLGQRT